MEAPAAAVSKPPRLVALRAAAADYIRRIWHHAADDDLLFLNPGEVHTAAAPVRILIATPGLDGHDEVLERGVHPRQCARPRGRYRCMRRWACSSRATLGT